MPLNLCANGGKIYNTVPAGPGRDPSIDDRRKALCSESEAGIVICGTGIGISITANKVPGIRAALCTDCFCAEATRAHNDANILALGGRVVGEGLALKIVDTFLDTPFSNDERHIRRIRKIEG